MVLDSSKEIPCFDRLAAAFFSSHSKSDGILIPGCCFLHLVRDDLSVRHDNLLMVARDDLALHCHLFACRHWYGKAIKKTLGVNRSHATGACCCDGLTIEAVLHVTRREDARNVRSHRVACGL